MIFILLCCFSCSKPPSTEELDTDIAALEQELKNTETESKRYSGGLIKILLDVRKEMIKNTKVMLEQKRSGLKRFININYTIDAERYLPPQNKEEILNNIKEEIKKINDGIIKARKESARYSGGLIKVLVEVRAESLENSLVFIKQRELLLKYDIPFYSIIPKSDGEKGEKKFKTTPGEDIEKF